VNKVKRLNDKSMEAESNKGDDDDDDDDDDDCIVD
jgi:hypothetical protein